MIDLYWLFLYMRCCKDSAKCRPAWPNIEEWMPYIKGKIRPGGPHGPR
jgi:hypothetical protein